MRFSILQALGYCVIVVYFLWCIAGFFSVFIDQTQREVVFLGEQRIFLESAVRGFMGIILGGLAISAFLSFNQRFRVSMVFLFLCIYIGALLFLNSSFKPMYFFGVVMTWLFFYYIPYFSRLSEYQPLRRKLHNVYYFTMVALLFLAIAPIFLLAMVYLVYGDVYHPFGYQFYMYDGLRGFSLDRVQYSYVAGLAFLSFYLSKVKNKNVYLFFIIIGLMMCHSRAVIVCLFVALNYHFYVRARYFSMILTIVPACLLFFVVAIERGVLIHDSPRIDIYTLIYNEFKDYSLINWLTGRGEFYSVVGRVHQPHNHVLQTLLNFGIITTLLFLRLIYNYFCILEHSARVILLYIFGFGVFHAGFSALVFIPITVIGYWMVSIINFHSISFGREKAHLHKSHDGLIS